MNRGRVIRTVVVLSMLVAPLCGPNTRSAYAGGGGGVPAISQYVESMPTSGGSASSGGGSSNSGPPPTESSASLPSARPSSTSSSAQTAPAVPTHIVKQIAKSGGTDRKTLLNLMATEPRRLPPDHRAAALVAPAPRGALAAIRIGDATPLLVLLLAIVGSAVAAAGLAFVLRGSRRERLAPHPRH